MSEITELSLALTAEDERNIFGGNDTYIRKIEDSLHVEIIDRNGELHIIGDKEGAQKASEIIRELVQLSRRGSDIEEQSVDYAILLKDDEEKKNIPETDSANVLADIDRDIICHTISGKPIKPKTLGQKKYIDAIRNKMIVFGIGPAGTGKTYLAMAMAITAFQREEVSRIILTRPAIEAGEKLGFLPGDLQSKVDPYLRPLYDALYQIMGTENFIKNMEKGLIEVAPLAYMRGRTLDNAFIILDEAQNTTPAQMKMFLTRIGFGSKVIITGDETQKDLSADVRSGLDVAQSVLKSIDDIAFCKLTSSDVVRHPLVQKIVKAYEDFEKKSANKKTKKEIQKMERRSKNGK
ncbi:MAG: PhoH family protein [Butyrivibrio sp.]|nr:PhoH family protein [Butyrivibrio sp.]